MPESTILETTHKAARPSPGRGINPSGRMMRAMERDAEARIARALDRMRRDLLRGLNENNVRWLPQRLASREILQPFTDSMVSVLRDIAFAGAEFGQEQVERFVFGVQKSADRMPFTWWSPGLYSRMDAAGISVKFVKHRKEELEKSGLDESAAFDAAILDYYNDRLADEWTLKKLGVRQLINISWDLANEAAAEWALWHGQNLSGQLAKVTSTRIQKLVSEWVGNDESITQLAKRINNPKFGWFNPKRARTIAVTETTRAFAEGNTIAWKESGVVKKRRWNTSVDEMVCPICGPLHNVVVGIDGTFPGGHQNPPAHPRCRCWITPVVGGAEERETGLGQHGL